MVNGQRLALNELDLSGGISLEAAGRSLTLPPSLSRGCFGPSIRAWYARDTKLLGWICKLNSGLAVAVLRIACTIPIRRLAHVALAQAVSSLLRLLPAILPAPTVIKRGSERRSPGLAILGERNVLIVVGIIVPRRRHVVCRRGVLLQVVALWPALTVSALVSGHGGNRETARSMDWKVEGKKMSITSSVFRPSPCE